MFAGVDTSDLSEQLRHERPDLSYVGVVKGVSLKPFDDVYVMRDGSGNLHTFCRLISERPTQQTFGEFDDLIRDGLVALEEFAIQNGFKFDTHRVTTLTGAHRTESPSESTSAVGEIPAILVSAIWKPSGKEQRLVNEGAVVEVYKHRIEGYDEVYEKHDELTARLKDPFLSSKGWGIWNLPFITPNFMPGRKHQDNHTTTFEDFAKISLTILGNAYDRFKKVRAYSRQGLQKGTLKGMPNITTQEVPEFAFSMPVKTEDLSTIMSVTGSRGSRDQNNKLGPLEERLIDPISYRSLQAEHIHKLDPFYKAARAGAPNPESGRGISRLVVRGEAIGPSGELYALTDQELVQRACEEVVNWLEEFGSDLLILGERDKSLSDDDWEDKLKKAWAESGDHQRAPGTFTFMFIKRSIDYSLFGNGPFTDEVTDILINIPWIEQSISKRREELLDPDGEPVPTFIDEKGNFQYGVENSSEGIYASRNLYNDMPGEGISGVEALGSKIPSHESPIHFDIKPWWREFLNTLQYANRMTPDFISTSYANDSTQANIQALGIELKGLARSLIFHTGIFVNHLAHKFGMPNGVKPPDVYRGFVEKLPHSDVANEIAGKKPIVREIGFGKWKRPFDLMRNLISKLFPDHDENSAFGDFIENVALDVRKGGKARWVETAESRNRQYKQVGDVGYCVIDQFAGIDVEVPMHLYLQFFNARIANELDELQKYVDPSSDHIVIIHQTDLIRDWNEYFRYVKDLEKVQRIFHDELSTSFLEAINESRAARGLQPSTVAPKLDFKLSGQEIIQLLQEGSSAIDEDGQNIVERIYQEASDNFKVVSALNYGLTTQDIRSIPSFRTNFSSIIDSYLPGGKKYSSFIENTLQTAITFRFCFIARFKVVSVEKEYGDSFPGLADYIKKRNNYFLNQLTEVDLGSSEVFEYVMDTARTNQDVILAFKNRDSAAILNVINHKVDELSNSVGHQTGISFEHALFANIHGLSAEQLRPLLIRYRDSIVTANIHASLRNALSERVAPFGVDEQELLNQIETVLNKPQTEKETDDAKFIVEHGMRYLLSKINDPEAFAEAFKWVKWGYLVDESVINVDKTSAARIFELAQSNNHSELFKYLNEWFSSWLRFSVIDKIQDIIDIHNDNFKHQGVIDVNYAKDAMKQSFGRIGF